MSQKKSTGKSREYNPSGRRWWLKLEYAFFFDKRVCALRRKLGDRALIFYEKIMLRSLENSCTMKFEGLEETFEDEIAVDIMEENVDSVQLIRDIMDFLIKHRLMVEQEDKSYLFTQAAEMSGDESSSAERMRRKRERDKEASQSDELPSQNDEASQCDIKTSQRYHIQNNNNNRSRAKSRIDLDLELELKQESDTEQADADIVSVEHRAASAAADAAAPPAAELFSVDQLKEIVSKHKIDLTSDGVKAFHSEMQTSGWILYKKPVEKAGIVKSLRGWTKYHEECHEQQQNTDSDDVEGQIYDRAREYISLRRFNENPDINEEWYKMILKYCPPRTFNAMQLGHIHRNSGLSHSEIMHSMRREKVDVDKYLEDEE